jgi:hydrogenase/urease accessory protein HupE
VLAHTDSVGGGFVGGLAHPLFGPDHVLAMVAVGLWGAFLGPPAIFVLPIVFPLVMALGGVLGILSVPLPSTEAAIAISAVVLGLMVALAARLPIWVAAAVVGGELPRSMGAACGRGCVIAAARRCTDIGCRVHHGFWNGGGARSAGIACSVVSLLVAG